MNHVKSHNMKFCAAFVLVIVIVNVKVVFMVHYDVHRSRTETIFRSTFFTPTFDSVLEDYLLLSD